MVRNTIFVLILALVLVSCNENNPSDMSDEQIHSLAIKIQKEFSYLNSQSEDIDDIEFEKLAHKIHEHQQEINKVRDSMQKDEVSRDVLVRSAKLYDELLTCYKDAGYNVSNMKSKVRKMKTALDME